MSEENNFSNGNRKRLAGKGLDPGIADYLAELFGRNAGKELIACPNCEEPMIRGSRVCWKCRSRHEA